MGEPVGALPVVGQQKAARCCRRRAAQGSGAAPRRARAGPRGAVRGCRGRCETTPTGLVDASTTRGSGRSAPAVHVTRCISRAGSSRAGSVTPRRPPSPGAARKPLGCATGGDACVGRYWLGAAAGWRRSASSAATIGFGGARCVFAGAPRHEVQMLDKALARPRRPAVRSRRCGGGRARGERYEGDDGNPGTPWRDALARELPFSSLTREREPALERRGQ